MLFKCQGVLQAFYFYIELVSAIIFSVYKTACIAEGLTLEKKNS